MSADLHNSELFVILFLAVNAIAVLGGLVWAYRGGLMSDLDETMKTVFLQDGEAPKENHNG